MLQIYGLVAPFVLAAAGWALALWSHHQSIRAQKLPNNQLTNPAE
jgi:hypothetical protein